MKREEAETIKREAYEAIIEMCETRANLFPAHSELIIHMVAGDMQEICRLARLGLRVKWPSEEDINLVARAINGASPTYQQCARAALSALTEQQ